MKRQILKCIVWLLVIVLPSSCIIEREDTYYGGSNGGRQTFEAYESNMEVLISFLDLAIRMDHYLSVPDSERFEAEQEYFAEYKIRPVSEEEWAGLSARDTAFRIVTGGKRLWTEGTVWKVYNYTRMPASSFAMLTCSGEKDITLSVKAGQTWEWLINAELHFRCDQQTIPADYNAGTWSIDGSGKCTSIEYNHDQPRILLDFEITRLLQKLPGHEYVANDGEISLIVQDKYLQREEKIKTSIENLSDYGRRVHIFYKGEEYRYDNRFK